MPTKIRNVALFINKQKSGAAALGKKITSFLENKKISVCSSLEFDTEICLAEADLAVSLGGDGTILFLARSMRKRSVPVFGVNFGRLGFLNEVSPTNAIKELGNCLAGKLKIEERMMLECHVRSDKHKINQKLV